MKGFLSGVQYDGPAVWTPALRHPAHTGVPDDVGDGRKLEVNVACTSPRGTVAALRHAARLAADLRGYVRVLAPLVVPFPLEIDRPAVSPEFLAESFKTLAAKVGIYTDVHICLCRNPMEAFMELLRPNSLVVVGSPWRPWPTQERKLARSLECKGHDVLLVDADKAL
jgi:hypothetical protein